MRVVGGKYRHRLLVWPEDNKHIRPTKDRIREAIFSALGDISGYTCLDLYAGSGAMGIEALSREAERCVFCDINKVALTTIKKNLETLKVGKETGIIFEMSDLEALYRSKKLDIKYDLVFIDPPYKEGKYQEIVDLLFENDILSEKAIIVVESDRDIVIDSERFTFRRDYKYGEIKVAILRR